MNVVFWIDNMHLARLIEPAYKVLENLYGSLNFMKIYSSHNLPIDPNSKIDKQDLKHLDFDLVLVETKNFANVLSEAKSLGLDEEKFILARTVLFPNFTLEKYKKLRRSKLSILSMNCFAGILSNRLGLQFLSPTINMYTSDKEFLNFISDPIKCINSELIFSGTGFNDFLNINYPIFKIGEAFWHMNHYSDINLAKLKWFERSKKINWFNLLVVMYTENPDVVAEFDKLPFAKKVCFVNFKTDLNSAYFINLEKVDKFNLLGEAVNGIATNEVPFFDMWDMLLYGKKTSLV